MSWASSVVVRLEERSALLEYVILTGLELTASRSLGCPALSLQLR